MPEPFYFRMAFPLRSGPGPRSCPPRGCPSGFSFFCFWGVLPVWPAFSQFSPYVAVTPGSGPAIRPPGPAGSTSPAPAATPGVPPRPLGRWGAWFWGQFLNICWTDDSVATYRSEIPGLLHVHSDPWFLLHVHPVRHFDLPPPEFRPGCPTIAQPSRRSFSFSNEPILTMKPKRLSFSGAWGHFSALKVLLL